MTVTISVHAWKFVIVERNLFLIATEVNSVGLAKRIFGPVQFYLLMGLLSMRLVLIFFFAFWLRFNHSVNCLVSLQYVLV